MEPNASTKQENILNSQISKMPDFFQQIIGIPSLLLQKKFMTIEHLFRVGVALGIPVNQFDDLDVPEVVEFRKDAVNLCKEIVEKREESLETHALYKFSAQIAKTGQEYDQMFPGGMVSVKVWFDSGSNRSVTVRVAVEAYGETVIGEALEVYSKGRPRDSRCNTEYVLKICGRQEYLLGSYRISQYKVIIINLLYKIYDDTKSIIHPIHDGNFI